MLGLGWKDGVATIVDRRLVHKSTEPDMGEFAGQGVEAFEFIADVEADDGSAHFRAPVQEPFNAITFKPPAVGQRVLSMAELVELKKRVDSGEITEAEFEAKRAGGGSPAD